MGKSRNFFLHVTAFLNVDWSYLTSHLSIAVTCINKFATLPHDYPSLLLYQFIQCKSNLDLHITFNSIELLLFNRGKWSICSLGVGRSKGEKEVKGNRRMREPDPRAESNEMLLGLAGLGMIDHDG